MSEKLWPDAYISTEDHKATLTEKDRIIRDLESSHRDQLADLSEELAERDRQIAELQQWVNDLQSGMYINCVYCGHRYGPKENTPVSMADILKAHVEQCPKHPMSYLKQENSRLTANNLEAAKQIAALTAELAQWKAGAEGYSEKILELLRQLAALQGHVRALLGIMNTVEVLGEWSGQDRNHRTAREYRKKVDGVIAAARAALAPQPPAAGQEGAATP